MCCEKSMKVYVETIQDLVPWWGRRLGQTTFGQLHRKTQLNLSKNVISVNGSGMATYTWGITDEHLLTLAVLHMRDRYRWSTPSGDRPKTY